MFSRSFLSARQCARAMPRAYTTAGEPAPPPMLLKIRKNLKDAMRAKDTNKLAVLRTLLAQTLNASKTNSPILTDMHMLALIKKNQAASSTAAAEFLAAGRHDLAEKEQAQLKVYDEYSSGVELMAEEDIKKAVQGVVDELKAAGGKLAQGEVMKNVLKVVEGKNVDKGQVAKIIKELITGSK